MNGMGGPDYEAAVEHAKRTVERFCGRDGVGREWLDAAPRDSYLSEGQHCHLYVLEGSPPRGYVLRTPYFVAAIRPDGRRLHTWHSWDVPA
mgnify:CR=1 FL=1